MFGGIWEALEEGYALWTTTSGTGGSKISAGIPNIGGIVTTACYTNSPILGAFKTQVTSSCTLSTSGGSVVKYSSFNASDGECGTQYTTDKDDDIVYANNVYGKSETVQPPAIKVFAWKRMA
jgi:hypothetical protein